MGRKRKLFKIRYKKIRIGSPPTPSWKVSGHTRTTKHKTTYVKSHTRRRRKSDKL